MKKGISKIIFQAILVGFLSGLIVVAFKLSIDNLFCFVKNNFYTNPFLFVLITTIGGLVSGLLVYKFAPETSGSGIPFVKIAMMKSGVAIRIRTIFVKFIAGVIGIGTGLSLGREGPSVQLGAGIGSFVGKIFGLTGNNKEKLIASGAGAAIGATFNAPIAGTLFVLEELTHKFSPSLMFMTIIATVISSTVGRYFLGLNPSFNTHLPSILISRDIFIVCVIIGIFAGIFGILFSKMIFFFNNFYSKISVPNYFKPAIAGFITGLIGLFVPYILSSGNFAVETLLNYKFSITLVLIIFILKLIITPLCFGSGAAGGIFLPMLTIGAFMGYILGVFSNYIGFEINLIAAASLGMAGFLSAVARTPLTAVIMVFEMTGGYECILPLMLTVASAEFVSEKYNQKPIYSQLAINQYKKLGLKISKDLKVKDVMKTPTIISSSSLIGDILETMEKEKHNTYPIADSNNKLIGITKKDDIKDVLTEKNKNILEINKILDTNPVTVYEQEDLYSAFFKIHEASENCAIVIDNEKNIIGIISRKDILDYNN